MWSSEPNETFGGFQDDTNSQTPKKGGDRVQSLVPMLAKHIANLKTSGGNVTFFDQGLHLIRICGILKSQELSSTKATYEVEDFSGTVNVIYWLNHVDDGTPVTPQVMTGTYVHVIGSIRNQHDRIVLMAVSMTTVTNLNIPTTHIIEAVHARYIFEHGSRYVPGSNPSMETTLGNSMIMDSKQNNKLTTFETQVLNVIKSVDNVNGCPIETIKDALRCSLESVMVAAKRLNSEGHIYTTKNELTYKATDLIM